MNLKELAQTLGLSQTTVSRALNGYSDVSPETRDRIVRAAKACNYRPSARARSLATGRSRRVAIMAAEGEGQGLSDPLFCAFLSGAVEVLERQDFDWVVRHPKCGSKEPQIAQLATDTRLEGAILTAPSKEDWHHRADAKTDFPILVWGDFCGQQSSVSGVDYDHRMAMQVAIAALADAGHHHIALITGPRHRLQTQSQIAAYVNAMENLGLQASTSLVHSGAATPDFGTSTVERLSRNRTGATAAVIGCSLTAVGAAAAVARLTPDADRDLSLVVYDDGPSWLSAAVCMDSFATITTPADALGRAAATRLVRQIKSPDTVSDVQLLAPGFALGQVGIAKRQISVGPAERKYVSGQAILS